MRRVAERPLASVDERGPHAVRLRSDTIEGVLGDEQNVGPDPNSSNFAGVTPDVDGGVAVAKCREGDAATAIPILQRKLSDAGFTLPPRG